MADNIFPGRIPYSQNKPLKQLYMTNSALILTTMRLNNCSASEAIKIIENAKKQKKEKKTGKKDTYADIVDSNHPICKYLDGKS
jgi:hypothetical protein